MQGRTSAEVNKNEQEEREKRIKALTGQSTGMKKEEQSSKDDLDPSETIDPDLKDKYDTVRPKISLQLSIEVSQEQEQEQQQQQQQQQQLQQQFSNALETPDAPADYPTHKGYDDLISIQAFNQKKLQNLGVLAMHYPTFRCIANTFYDSEKGGFGYITVAAANKITEDPSKFQSGLPLEEKYLPAGFCISITEGERHLSHRPKKVESDEDDDDDVTPVSANKTVKTVVATTPERQRLVLEYKPEHKSKDHPLKLRLMPSPEPCKILGDSEQFPNLKEWFTFEYFFPTNGRWNAAGKNQKRTFDEVVALKTGIPDLKGDESKINHVIHYREHLFAQIDLKNYPGGYDFAVNKPRLFNLMRNMHIREEKELAESIITKHQSMLDFFDLKQISQLFHVFYTYGCTGIQILLDKLHPIFRIDQGNTLFCLLNSIFDASTNWNEYLEKHQLAALDKIREFNPNELLWWNALSSQHVKSCGYSDLEDLVSAFIFFRDQLILIGNNNYRQNRAKGLEKDDPDYQVELPKKYLKHPIRNMKVVMVRILDLLRNASNFKQQLSELHELNLNNNDICYPARQGFKFITKEMEFGDVKAYPEVVKEMEEGKHTNFPLAIIYTQMIDKLIVSETRRDGTAIPPSWFYRYLGMSAYAGPYDEYKKVMDIYSEKINPEKNTFKDENQKYIGKIILLTIETTTHERGFKCKIVDGFNTLMNVTKYYNYDSNTEYLPTRLVNLVTRAKWLNLSELTLIAMIFASLTSANRDFLSEKIIEKKLEFIDHLTLYRKNWYRLDGDDYVTCLKEIEKLKDEVLKTKLPRLFSIVNRWNIHRKTEPRAMSVGQIDQLIKELTRIGEINGRPVYEELLDIFSILTVKINDNNQYDTKSYPTMDEFIAALQKMGNMGRASVDQYVSQKEHALPESCTYDPAQRHIIIQTPIDQSKYLKAFLAKTKEYSIPGVDEKRILAEDLGYIFQLSKARKSTPIEQKTKVTEDPPKPLETEAKKTEKCDGYLSVYRESDFGGPSTQLETHFVPNTDHDNLPPSKEPLDDEPYIEVIRMGDNNEDVKMKEPPPKALKVENFESVAHQCIKDLQENRLRIAEHKTNIGKKSEEKIPSVKTIETEKKAEQDRIRLNILIKDFRPHLSDKVDESITPMQEYIQEVEIFINALNTIQQKWPDSISDILIKMSGERTRRKAPKFFKFLNYFLSEIANSFSARLPFPHEFLNLLLLHSCNHQINYELLAVKEIFGLKKVKREHKNLLFKLNMAAAVDNVDIGTLITRILQYHHNFSIIFDPLLNILKEYPTELELVFRYSVKLLSLLADINDEKLTKKIFDLFSREPYSYSPILAKLFSDEKPTVSEKIITTLIFQACDPSEFDPKSIAAMIDDLNKEDVATLRQLQHMRPPPTFKTLVNVSKTDEEKKYDYFIKHSTDDRYAYRSIDEQFAAPTALNAINQLKNLKIKKETDTDSKDKKEEGTLLPLDARRKLYSQFSLINQYGHNPDTPIYLRIGGSSGTPLTAKDLTERELQELVIKCKTIFNSQESTTAEKENAQLVFIALVREAMWRATRKFPYSTQMLSVLLLALNKKNTIYEIDTGEGKGMIMAMLAALLWFEAGPVNVCTSNIELARVAFEEFSPAFDLLGIPRCNKIITAHTPLFEYCYDGINYSDTSQLALFIARLKLDPDYLRRFKHKPRFAGDEIDFTIFDDLTHYRYATYLHKVDLTWVPSLIYDFIHSKEYTNPQDPLTYRREFTRVRELLLHQAAAYEKEKPPPEKKMTHYIAKLPDRMLDNWIKASLIAKNLIEKKDFVVCLETHGTNEDSEVESVARPLAYSRVCRGSEFGSGVQGALQEDLARKALKNTRETPPFRKKPETAPITSLSSKDVIEFHGRVIGVTGTAGSPKEREELAARGIEACRIPPHKENKREVKPTIFAKGQEDHFKKILDAILIQYKEIKPPPPVLIAFNDIKKSNDFYLYLSEQLKKDERFKPYDGLRTQLLNGNQAVIDNKPGQYSEEKILSNAGISGTLTVATILDRGADFKPRLKDSDVNQNHCLYVIEAFPADPRTKRQIYGRCARNGQYGIAQSVYDINDFECLPVLAKNKGPATIKAFQDEQAIAAQRRRRFANQLATIKDFYFQKYIWLIQQPELATLSQTLMYHWTHIFESMDIIWNRHINAKYDLDDDQLLELLNKKIVHDISASWVKMIPEKMEKYWIDHNEEDDLLKKLATKPITIYDNEVEQKDQVQKNNISTPRDYNDNSPLLMFAPKETDDAPNKKDQAISKDPNKAATNIHTLFAAPATLDHQVKTTLSKEHKEYLRHAQKIIAQKRIVGAYECIGEVFGSKIKIINDIGVKGALKHLIEQTFNNQEIPPKTPYQKNLLEILAIAEWSKNEKFKMNIHKIISEALCHFAEEILAPYRRPRTITRTENALEDMRKFLITKKKEEEENEKTVTAGIIDQPLPIRTVVQVGTFIENNIKAPLSELASGVQYHYKDALRDLLKLIDHEFLFDPIKLQAEFKKAETSPEFKDSPFIKFNPPAAAPAPPPAEPVQRCVIC